MAGPNISALLQRINEKKLNQPADYKLWVEASDRVSVHAKGIRPKFKSQRKNSRRWVTPANYDERYQYLFDDYILNRHPNELEDHYHWRLSVFPVIAQEIYLNAKSQILGAIFQTSQYTIKANDEEDELYLKTIELEARLKGDIAEHVFTDPYGKIAVVEYHFSEFGSDEETLPDIELVESRFIKEFEPYNYILFQAKDLYEGKKLLYYIDAQWCVKLIETDPDAFVELTWYEHGFNELPVIDNDTNFFQPFVSWADMLARNISDDEVLAKNNSYPHKEIILPKCTACQGSGQATEECEVSELFPRGIRPCKCKECGGKGTININPGELFITPEHELNDLRPQQDRVKFYNPDISTNKFSFERWQKIYDMGMRSMHMKFVEEAQSGVAKAQDRELLYFLISNVSNKLFEIAEFCVRYTLAYRHLSSQNGIAVHEFQEYVVERPQQFQIKNEYDIQQEYVELLEKGADLFLRREKQHELVKKTFHGNNLALKKYNIIRVWDWLYGMTDDELNTRKLLGSATTNDFIRHDRAEALLNQLCIEKGETWLIEQPEEVIIAALDEKLKPFMVKDPVQIPEV